MIENWLMDAWIFWGMDIGMMIALAVILARKYRDERK